MSEFVAKNVKRYIKYCPFCGSSSVRCYDKTYYESPYEVKKYWYECKNCKARSGECPSRDEAAYAWNRRFFNDEVQKD